VPLCSSSSFFHARPPHGGISSLAFSSREQLLALLEAGEDGSD
jgi:hypothetical protein